MIHHMWNTALLLWHLTVAAPPLDSARVEAGHLVVDPIGLSFEIPAAWLTRVQTSGGPTCNLSSAQARSVNTSREALREVTGPSSYYGDQYYSALSDSIFAPDDLVAHLGGLGWRDCDNSVNDLQMRVYVSDATPEMIASRLPTIQLAPYRGYSPPKLAAARDSLGWHIEQFDWAFNCGDCVFPERLEVYSTRVNARTVALVFMYSPVNAIMRARGPQQRETDKHRILQSLKLASRGTR